MVGSDDVTWNDDLRTPPFHDASRAGPVFNQFAALWDLILTHLTKMVLFAPYSVSTLQGHLRHEGASFRRRRRRRRDS